MGQYEIKITIQAFKDIKKLDPKMKKRLKDIIEEILQLKPYSGKVLIGNLKGNYSYRLNLKDRIIYSVDEDKKTVYIKRTRTHYGD